VTRARLASFAEIVLLTGFVGAMVGSERSVLPLLAQRDAGQSSTLAALSFLVAFGLAKAAANLVTGDAASRLGLRRVLFLGWGFGIGVPLLLGSARSLPGLFVANLFLGANQGLCWSSTVLLALEAAGPERRGLAMGVNECGGYLAVALAALVTGKLSVGLGERHSACLVGAIACACGLLLSARAQAARPVPAASLPRGALVRALRRGMSERYLATLNQAGLVNNLKDGAAWGLFPLLYKQMAYPLVTASFLVSLYPAVWGVTQLGAGALSDRLGRRSVVAGGLLLQALALAGLAASGAGILSPGVPLASALAVALGLGTGMVHPTLMAAVGDATAASSLPGARAATLGVYRMWRDSGYAAGAVVAGVLADRLGLAGALGGVAGIVSVSATVFVAGSTAAARARVVP
jgi:MFS family permease